MSPELFEEWVQELDLKFGVEKRKIALVIDNCKSHPHVKILEWVELIFLPPNTTSVTQPMDQWIICALKAKYRSLVVRRLISSFEKKAVSAISAMSAISILSAITWFSKAWVTLLDKTFTNCFCKCEVSEEAVACAIADNDNPFSGLQEDEEDAVKTLATDLNFSRTSYGDQVDINRAINE